MNEIKLVAQLEVLNAQYQNTLKELDLTKQLCEVQRELIGVQTKTIQELRETIDDLSELNTKIMTLVNRTM